MGLNRNIVDLYKYYKNSTINELQVDKDTYKKIVKSFSAKVIKSLFEAEEVKLPIVGTLRIKKIKQKYNPNRMKKDYVLSKKIGKTVYFTNEHRNGYFYAIKWRKSNIKNISYYSFIGERHHLKRPLSKILQTDFSKDFFEN